MDTKQLLIDKLQADNAREIARLDVHNTLAAILRDKWDGKKINARLATQLKTALGYPESAIVNFQREYGMGQVYIWGAGTVSPDYNGRMCMLIGYDSLPGNEDLTGAYLESYGAKSFERTDICHGSAAAERIESRAALLKDDATLTKLAAHVDAVQSNWDSLRDMTAYGTPAHELNCYAENLARGGAL